MVNAAAEAYKRQQIMTATPEALTLMLYNGALRFMSEGKEALEKKDYESANNSIIKAEKIITEFRVTLDLDYEISHQLLPLYNYVSCRAIWRATRRRSTRRRASSASCATLGRRR